MQGPAGEPTAKGCVDRAGQPDQTLFPGQPGGIAGIDAGKCLAKTVQRGLWRGRAHGYPLNCSCFVLRFPIPGRMSSTAVAGEFSPSLEGVKLFPKTAGPAGNQCMAPALHH